MLYATHSLVLAFGFLSGVIVSMIVRRWPR